MRCHSFSSSPHPVLVQLQQRKRHYWRLDCKCIILFQNNTSNKYYKVKTAMIAPASLVQLSATSPSTSPSAIGDSSVRDPGGASCQKLRSGPGRHEPSLLRAHYWHHVLLCWGGPQHPPPCTPQQLTDSAPGPSLPKPGCSQQWCGPGGGQGMGERHPPSSHAGQLSGRTAGYRERNSQWVKHLNTNKLLLTFELPSYWLLYETW